MKKIWIFLLMTFSALLFAKDGDKISFKATTLDGEGISDAIFSQSEITMVNIWGTFCSPCIREMPDLARLSKANENRGVKIVGIVIDVADRTGKAIARQKNAADKIIAKTGADYTHILPSAEMQGGFLRGVQAVPTTIFVDKNGRQIGGEILGSRDFESWQKIIDSLLTSLSSR